MISSVDYNQNYLANVIVSMIVVYCLVSVVVVGGYSLWYPSRKSGYYYAKFVFSLGFLVKAICLSQLSSWLG